MKSYRDRYDEFTGKNATIIAISADKLAKQAEFRRTVGAEFSFVADPKGELIKAFGTKMPLIKLSKRTTLVIGKGCKVLHLEQGSSAVSPDGAAQACSLW